MNKVAYFILGHRVCSRLEMDVGLIFLTRPSPTHKWSDPTRPNPELTWNSGPDPTRPIYTRLLVLPSAAESLTFQLRCQHHRFTCHRLYLDNTSLMLEYIVKRCWMAMLQLLIIMNYSRWIIGLLSVNCIFIRYFWHWTRPTQDGEFCDPTRPDPTHPYGWTRLCPALACSTVPFRVFSWYCVNMRYAYIAFLADR